MSNPSVDASARHAIYVERLAASNANTIDPILKDLARFTRSRLAEEGSMLNSRRAMNSVVADIQREYKKGLGGWEKDTFNFIKNLSDYENQFQTGILDAETTDEYDPVKPDNKQVRKAVEEEPVNIGAGGGAVALTALVGGFAANEIRKVVGVILGGMGRQTSDLSSAITGTKANRFNDGLLSRSKVSATAISKTAANHVSAIASDVVYKKNKRAVKGYIITAVLDSSTSKTCRGWDDTKVSVDDDYQPKPPFHPNCRTTTRPWLRDDLDAIKKAERETKGAKGKKFENTSKQYYTWLKDQPAWFQDDILGKTEGKIFRNSGLSANEFKAATRKRDGTPLNISEMAQKDKRIKEYLEKLK